MALASARPLPCSAALSFMMPVTVKTRDKKFLLLALAVFQVGFDPDRFWFEPDSA